MAISGVVMAAVALAMRAQWPQRREWGHLAVAALLVHACYLGGVYIAVAGGMQAGTVAMLVGLQPLLTVVIARGWLGEHVVPRQWTGLAFGLAGVWFVVRHKISFAGDLSGLVPVVVALVGISVGTIYQKRYCAHVDLRTGAAVQYLVCALAYLPLVWVLEPTPIDWTPAFAFWLVWSVVVLSVAAISLLYWLLRHGEASSVARLFYLVPPVTAVIAWFMFGETLDALAIVGMALIALGVALARPRDKPDPVAAGESL